MSSSSSSSSSTTEARELALIGKVEMRIALASSDTQLQTLLNTYLAPLLLKLASEHVAVRNKVIAVCQHVSMRLRSSLSSSANSTTTTTTTTIGAAQATVGISLPVPVLLKQYRETDNGLVRHFDALYITQGLERLAPEERMDLLPELLQRPSSSTISFAPTTFAKQHDKLWTVGFFSLLRLLPAWKFPERGSKEDVALRDKFGLLVPDSTHLARYLGRFLLYDGKPTAPKSGNSNSQSTLRPAATATATSARQLSPGLSPEEEAFYAAFYDSTTTTTTSPPITLAILNQTKSAIATFLFSAVFSEAQRFIPAVILSADSTNLTSSRIGDTMFKQSDFDLESEQNVRNLYDLYFGYSGAGGNNNPARPKLRIRILTLLAKSKTATNHSFTEFILRIIDEQLFSREGYQTSGLEATKLRSAIFTFLNWVVRVGEDSSLQAVAPRAQESLKDFIESQGWPSSDTTGVGLAQAEVELRGKAYESIGILTTKVKPELDLVQWLFTSLRCDLSDSQIHVSIEEALGRVLNVFAAVSAGKAGAELLPILLWNMGAEIGDEDPSYGFRTRRSTKFAAVRYANRCLRFQDVDARWIDLLAVGGSGVGERQEVAEEGTKGLDPYWYRMMNPCLSGTSTTEPFPLFASLVDKFFGPENGRKMLEEPEGRYLNALVPAVAFCRNVLIAEALADTEHVISSDMDWERKIDATTSTNEKARSTVRQYFRRGDKDHVMEDSQGLETENPGHFPALSSLLRAALVGMSHNLVRCGELAVELVGLSSNDALSGMRDEFLTLAKRALMSNNLATQSQAVRVFGVLASLPAFTKTDHQNNLMQMIESCAAWKEAVGQQMNRTRGCLLGSAYLISRLSMRGISTALKPQIHDFSHLVSDILVNSRDLALRDATNVAIGQLCLCLNSVDLNHLDWDKNSVISSLVKDAKKEQEVAVAALGRLIWCASNTEKPMVEKILEHLYALQDVRKPELHLAVGETLAVAATGWHSTSTVTDFDVDASFPTDPVNNELLSEIVDKVIQDCKTTKPSLKKASAIWLLCLVQYCGSQPAVQSRLRHCQATFARLLSDRDEVVQETGSRGLGLVYQMGDKNLREELVRDLVQSFTGSDVKMSGTVDEETELFDAGALPTGEGSVTTYKDIVSLASEMGDPSLVYRFMNLASNNAIWSSRAAFGRFGLGNVLADSAFLSDNKKFYPKLYRYRFDPNPNVQRSMNEIWRALVKDPNAIMDQNFDEILQDLLQSILGREWRVREASCAAIADLVQGRDVEKYERYLNEIWSVAFKVLDDIKETVRVAAMTLCRTLTNILIRNLEIGEGANIRARNMLEHVVPFLLRQLETGSAQEVQQYATVTLLQLVKKTPPNALRPFAPVILETLVNSLSSLEHEGINYLHLNAEKYGLTAGKLDKMRVSNMNTSPVTEAIDRCLESLDPSTDQNNRYLKDAMKRLESCFKTAIGLPSKVGLSRVMVTLGIRHTVLFRPYADRFVELIRKNILDRNETVSVAYSMSLAYLMRLASEKQVGETILFIEDLYFASDEASHRVVAAEIVQSISKVSNDKLLQYATSFLPLAYVGRNDSEEHVKDRFSQTWQENVGGSRAVVLYLTEILELVAKHIKSTRWALKHACCLAVADLASTLTNQANSQGQYSAAQAEAIWKVLQEALAGKTWDGKERVITAFPEFVKGARYLWQVQGSHMKMIALREARRTNSAYRPHAIAALGKFAYAREDLDLTDEILLLVAGVMAELTAEEDDRADVSSIKEAGTSGSGESKRESSVNASIACVFETLSSKSGSTSVLDLERTMRILDQAKAMGFKSTESAICDGAKIFIDQIAPAVTSTKFQGQNGEIREEVAAFSSEVIVSLLAGLGDTLGRGQSGVTEAARVKLGNLVAGYAKSPVASNHAGRRRIITALEEWLKSERSHPVRGVIEQTLLALRNWHGDVGGRVKDGVEA